MVLTAGIVNFRAPTEYLDQHNQSPESPISSRTTPANSPTKGIPNRARRLTNGQSATNPARHQPTEPETAPQSPTCGIRD
jgi:hypothetical protein